jgi:hypothetical protein
MNIRYQVPCDFQFSLHCDAGITPIPEPSDYALHFVYHRYVVTVTPGKSHRLVIWTERPSGKNVPIYKVFDLSFQVQDDPDSNLQRMHTATQWVELTQLLMGITNHVLLNVRIVGGVTSLHAIPGWIPTNSPETTASPFILAEMNAETSSDDGVSWQAVACGWEGFREAKELKDLVLGVPVPGSVTAETWAGVERALDRTEPPDFARVCLSNAKESISSGDGRSAVLEGVFALEIVVDRVLDYYCSKMVPSGARNLRNMGFPEKLFLALPLATGQLWDWELRSNATEALAAIRDRNHVAHKGDLAPGRGDTKEFWDDVHATITLAETLLQHEAIIKSRIDHLAKPAGEETT